MYAAVTPTGWIPRPPGGVPSAGADGETGARKGLRKELGERSPDAGTDEGDDLAAALGETDAPQGGPDHLSLNPPSHGRSLGATALAPRPHAAPHWRRSGWCSGAAMWRRAFPRECVLKGM